MEMSPRQLEDIVRCMKASADMLDQIDRPQERDRKVQADRLREAARQMMEFSE